MNGTRADGTTLLKILAGMLVLCCIAVQVAHAAVVVSRAEVSSGRLRIEGSAAPSRTITVDGVAMGTSDGSGAFRIERSGYTPPADCTVDVNDGSTTPATARLSGCTVAPATPSPTPPPMASPTGSTPTPTPTTTSSGLRITDDVLPPGNVGTDYTGYIGACCGNGGPYRWRLVAGRVPDGLQFAGDSLRLVQTTAVLGRPTTVQTTTFTVEVRDGTGATARKTFSLTINPARPLAITNQTDTLAPGQVGVAYATGVFADGGVPPYRWSLVAGQLPPGLSLTTSPGRITGTPTAAGAFTFTLRVVDNGGQSATQQFSIAVAP
jgi:hypothetical protein